MPHAIRKSVTTSESVRHLELRTSFGYESKTLKELNLIIFKNKHFYNYINERSLRALSIDMVFDRGVHVLFYSVGCL